MVGNSPRSDILPVLELGGSAVFVPYETVWLHEAGALPPEGSPVITPSSTWASCRPYWNGWNVESSRSEYGKPPA